MCESSDFNYLLTLTLTERSKQREREADLHPVLSSVSTAGDPAARNTEQSGQGGGHEGQLTEVLLQPLLEHLRHGRT